MTYKRRQNWHHKPHKVTTRKKSIEAWIPRFREIAEQLKRDGVEVINASEETALDAFPRRPIAELLPLPDPRRDLVGTLLAGEIERLDRGLVNG